MADKFKLVAVSVLVVVIILLLSKLFGSNAIFLAIIALSIFEVLRRIYIKLKNSKDEP
ncbi:hypothetical protein [Photobacterium kasasachensis]|uniref:hypothetical protein n=1 Tax=Photobacterium kasasachensis TaxID=2910240 RepID=UPI003D099C68